MENKPMQNEHPAEILASMREAVKGFEEIRLIMKANDKAAKRRQAKWQAEWQAAHERRQAEYELRQAEAEKRQAEYELRQAEAAEESKRRQAEAAEESKRRQAEAAEESKRRQAKYDKLREELANEMKDLARKISELTENVDKVSKTVGDFGDSHGKFVESLVKPGVLATFREAGLVFKKPEQRKPIEDSEGNKIAEVDIILKGRNQAMFIEVKATLTTEKVTEHLNRMERIRDCLRKAGDRRRLYGAVAGVVLDEQTTNYAHKNGLFVLEPSGDIFNLATSKEKFTPRQW